ncbi:PQQ-binding-like beta-propeller repeat protein [Streptomyces sp. NPDC051940]|uniref:serine/threonine-protein kinase n=1 Tax=Streptomyces sp. NPDC051940 TaxID=3155675 RepID=UPI003429F71B
MVEQLTQHDPRRIGPFEVLARLGAGGMGLVYLARSASGRRVAIKTVRTELAEDQLFRVRFTREVEAARSVSGFYTAAVVDADPRAAVPWLATAYVPAPSLEEIITECGPLPPQAVRWLAAGIAEALQSIHGAGLVHRDLKPSNVLVVEDGPRVIDFGIASGVSNTRLTMTNVAVGTPAYMSPEQARDSRSVTGASDIFSLGSTLVFAGTGHAPFHGANPVETVFMLLREGPNLDGLPDELRPLIESCMQMSPEHRPSPAELQAQLAPHLFSSGNDDDTGTASAWLPGVAVELIEKRRGVRTTHTTEPRPAPPRPVGPPPRPDHPPVAVQVQQQPAPVAVEEPGGVVRLAGAAVPIGPGPRVKDATAARLRMTPDAHPVAGWVRPPGAGAHNGVPAARPAPAAVEEPRPKGGWRPWRFRMSNDVWGTPAVVNDLLYVTSFEVHALDVMSGRRQFKTREVAWTMAVADGRIHASDGPSLYALDASDGGERWRRSVDGWVYALRVDGGVVVTGTRGGGVQARDAVTGEPLWELAGAHTEFETPDAGPVIKGDTVFVWAEGRLRALQARTGAERWSYPVGDAAACGGVPVRLLSAPDGSVYVSAGKRVLALDAAYGRLRWSFEAPAVLLCPPAFAPGAAVGGGGVYLADYLGTVYALDATDGRERWRIATEARNSIEPVLVADGAVHVGSGSALYTLDAVAGTPKWRFATRGELIGTPVAADGRVHFGSADHWLYAVDAMGGQLRWKLETGGEITGSPVVAQGVVYACSKDRCVYALDAAEGTGRSGR